MTMTTDHDRVTQRAGRRISVRRAQRRVTWAEDKLSKAIAARDEVLIECHGSKRDGGLSYAELAEETGLSKGWVIQIVQPHRTGEATA